MANFLIAERITGASEGGYVFDKTDRGKETYRGISRKWFPDWAGWLYVDYCKGFKGFPNNINDRVLDGAVLGLFKREFWDVIHGDLIENQDLANVLYDAAVNMGQPVAVEFLQKVLNLLNRNQRDYPDLKADGVMGPQTRSAITLYINKRGPYKLILFFESLVIGLWIRLATNSKDQEKFMNGWGNRALRNIKQITDKYYGVQNHA